MLKGLTYFLLLISVLACWYAALIEKSVWDVMHTRVISVGEVISVQARQKDECDQGPTECNFLEGPFPWAYQPLHFRSDFLEHVKFTDEKGVEHFLVIGANMPEVPGQVGKKYTVLYDPLNPDRDPLRDPGIRTFAWHIELWWKKLMALFSLSFLLYFLHRRNGGRSTIDAEALSHKNVMNPS